MPRHTILVCKKTNEAQNSKQFVNLGLIVAATATCRGCMVFYLRRSAVKLGQQCHIVMANLFCRTIW